jgi:hypothetical protein
VLHLIKMWLECPVEEADDRGRKTRTTEARDNRRGIPQGSPISPLLANLYMRRFVLGWKMLGLERSLGTRLVTYADDLVILCRKGKADEALQQLRKIMSKLKLTVCEEKTRICKVPEGDFDFLIRGDNVCLPSVDRDGDKSLLPLAAEAGFILEKRCTSTRSATARAASSKDTRNAAADCFAWRSVLRTVV